VWVVHHPVVVILRIVCRYARVPSQMDNLFNVTITGLTVRNAVASGSGGGVLVVASPASPSTDMFPTAVVIDDVAFDSAVASQQSSSGGAGAVVTGGAVAVLVPEGVTSSAFSVVIRSCSFRHCAAVARRCCGCCLRWCLST
jgi:hypothetical protein